MGMKMKLFVFTGSDKQVLNRLLTLVGTVVPENTIEIFTTIDSLSNTLRRFHSGPVLALILTSTPNDLMNILLLKDQLNDVPMILVLPDRKPSTISTGTRLHPRFISYIDSDFQDVVAVLEKMIQKLK